MHPIVKLTRKDNIFEWSQACQKAFEVIKDLITQAPVLRHFNITKEAILETDSSDYVNGGILSQYNDEGVLHSVAYYSKNLNPAECNYQIPKAKMRSI